MGKYLHQKLNEMSENYIIENIRGHGLLIAFDVGSDISGEISNKCFEDGLLINACKPYSLRLMPPLIVSTAEINEMLTIVKKYLTKR